MYGYIYLTENLINGKCYIGQHKSKQFNTSYKGSGIHLKLAINKYGRDNFVCQPIQWCETKEELDIAEMQWIKMCDAVNSPYFYNIASGGSGVRLYGSLHPFYGKHHTEESKKKIGRAQIGEKNTNWGKHENHPFYGKHHTEETKRKISESNKGKQDKKGANNPMFGKHFTEEQKKKISESRKGQFKGANNPSYGRHWKLVDGHRQYLD